MGEHIPVMQEEVRKSFEGMSVTHKLHFDGTFGRGGHARMMLEQYPDLRVIACDQDADAVEFARSSFAEFIESGRLQIHRGKFSDLEKYTDKNFETMLLDLGVSSPQLDQADRGFSFMHEGPLDMRMDQRLEVTAADIVNGWSEKELIELFQEYGEVRSPYRVVKAIIHDRKTEPFTQTRQLAGMIERVAGWHRKGFNPATQYFMALRLQVNQELEELKEGLNTLVQRLTPGGRLTVITFHSLEDRIVKQFFKNNELGGSLHKKVIQPTDEEIKINFRSRSAKLRIFERAT